MERARATWTDERLDDLARVIERGFDGVGSRMDRVGSRMDRVGSRMDRLDARMDRLDARMDRLEARFDGLQRLAPAAAITSAALPR